MLLRNSKPKASETQVVSCNRAQTFCTEAAADLLLFSSAMTEIAGRWAEVVTRAL